MGLCKRNKETSFNTVYSPDEGREGEGFDWAQISANSLPEAGNEPNHEP